VRLLVQLHYQPVLVRLRFQPVLLVQVLARSLSKRQDQKVQ
jgi:hypothetical protein